MQICYVDESGDDSDLLSAQSNTQPVFAIGGLIIDSEQLHALTLDFLHLKATFFPALCPSGPHLDRILPEIKGSELRKKIAIGTRQERRHAIGVLDHALDVIEGHGARYVGRVWVKAPGIPFGGRAVYTSSVQSIHEYFQSYLENIDDLGVLIADSRTFTGNVQVAHSIFTQKFKRDGDSYDRIIDLPTFAHSNNHAAIQLSDFLCSGVITPMAIETYCRGHINNLHVRPGYHRIKARYKDRIQALQYRYQRHDGRLRGGITVTDKIAGRGGGHLFRP